MDKESIKIKKPLIGTLLIIIIVSFIVIGILYNNKRLIKNDVGSVAYDNNSKGDYRIYIKEDNEYVPYLVLSSNYNNTKNALLLRENVVGGKDYYIDENKLFNLEKIVYPEQIGMAQYTNYDKTDADKYLSEEFYKKFNEQLLNKISYTELEITDNENPEGKNFKIKRKFFLLSLTELGLTSTWDKSNSKQKVLKYFKHNTRISKNDSNIDVIWWTRSYCWASFCAISTNGYHITESSTDVEYGLRPAFTIPSTTKIRREYNNQLSKEINIISY